VIVKRAYHSSVLVSRLFVLPLNTHLERDIRSWLYRTTVEMFYGIFLGTES
jgi:hypothetical protein